MLEPIRRSSNTARPPTRIVRKAALSSRSSTSPSSSMIPVNICRQNKIRTGRRHDPIPERNRLRQFVDPFTTDRWNLTATEDLGRNKDDYLINDSGTKGAESQIWTAFHEKALDFAAIEFPGKILQCAAKNQSITKGRDSSPAIQNHA